MRLIAPGIRADGLPVEDPFVKERTYSSEFDHRRERRRELAFMRDELSATLRCLASETEEEVLAELRRDEANHRARIAAIEEEIEGP